MTDQQAIQALKAIRVYCQPEQVPAVDRAIAALRRRAEGDGEPGQLQTFC